MQAHHNQTDHPSEPHTCCCQHGSKCTCSLKKEHLDPVPEDIPQLIQPKDHPKPRTNHNTHESKPTVITNGHHKPVHKFNDAHNQLGNPYKIPSRSHSLHGHRDIAQRSTDSLPLTKHSRPFHESPLHNSITDAIETVQRKVKSEHASPILGPQSYAVNPTIQDLSLPSFDPNAYSYSPFGTDSPNTQNPSLQNSQNASQQDLTQTERIPESWFMSYEQAHDYEPPAFNYNNDTSSIDWSTYNFDTGSASYTPPNNENSPYIPQQQTYNQYDLSHHINRIGLTSSSGEPSEVEEHSPPNPWSNDRSVSNDRQVSIDGFNDISSPGDDASDKYRLSSASSYYGTPQANMLASDNLTGLDIDDYIKRAEQETARMALQNQLAQMQMAQHESQQQQQQQSQQPASRLSSVSRGMTPSVSTPGSTGEHSFTVREAQRYAHLDGFSPEPLFSQKNTMAPSMVDDPSWSAAPDLSDPELALNDERDDENWVR